MKTVSLAARLSKSFSLLAAVLIAVCGASLYYSMVALKPIYDRDVIWVALVAGEILVISVIMMMVTRRLCSKHLEKQLGELKTGAQRLAAGDFSGRLQVFGQDELGSFAKAMNNSNTYLVNLLKSVYAISGELVKATEQLSELAAESSGYNLSLGKDTHNLGAQLVSHQEGFAGIQNSLHKVFQQINLLRENSDKYIQNMDQVSQMMGELEMTLSKTGKHLLAHSQAIGENCDSLVETAEKAAAIEDKVEAIKSFIQNIKEILLSIALEAAKEGKPELAEKARILNNISHDLISGVDKTIVDLVDLRGLTNTSVDLLKEGREHLTNIGEEFHVTSVSFQNVKENTDNCLDDFRGLDDSIRSTCRECTGLQNQLDAKMAFTGNILEAMAGVKASVKLINGRAKTIQAPVRQIERATKKLQNLSLQFKT